MINKYLFFLVLGPIANLLWALWVLPQINERGNGPEMLQWLLVQSLFPAAFCLLIGLKHKLVYWLLIIYSGFMILFAIGMLGWALMGPEAPLSIYAVCFLLLIMGFGIMYNSFKDSKLGQKIKRYETQD